MSLVWLLFAVHAPLPPVPRSGLYHLPQGVVEVAGETRIPDGAHDLTIVGNGTTLRAAARFSGRAVLSCRNCRRVTFRDFRIDGNRDALARPQPLPPTDAAFSAFYANNGILLEDSETTRLERVAFAGIAGLALLANHCHGVAVDTISVDDSGSLNAKGRNNATGGVLFEEGTVDFSVRNSAFRHIRGNALWTHSRYKSPRNGNAIFDHNTFAEIGRDAIQVGHATQVKVTANEGRRIGFPNEVVDLENLGTPVGIDTSGNVDASTYENNRFEEVNGKCIDLDGFHDGAVRSNVCVNRGAPADYPYGNFGISFNNTSIEMRSENVTVENNRLEGMKFGGIFVIGRNHKILRNEMHRLDTSHCNESKTPAGCVAIADEPEFLESGIYLGKGAERPDPAFQLTIEGNILSGWKMQTRCIQAAPGVKLSDSTLKDNHCSDE